MSKSIVYQISDYTIAVTDPDGDEIIHINVGALPSDILKAMIRMASIIEVMELVYIDLYGVYRFGYNDATWTFKPFSDNPKAHVDMSQGDEGVLQGFFSLYNK
ncbi:MAG: hypothetical protein EHM49_06535 [Deltaproteobacteria bacterium]|nr:MAG: hypothetical protein EHM49_06535 [Deltaproteobacteria bacterium]